MKVVFSCGRANPPTLGHLKVVETMRRLARERDADVMVFLTKTVDAKRNPLAPEVKVEMAKRAFGCDVRLTTSPYSALEELQAAGVTEATFVIGEDRRDRFLLMEKYATEGGIKLRYEVVSRTEEDVSATAARDAVTRDDFETFKSLVPSPDGDFARDLFRAVGLGLGG